MKILIPLWAFGKSGGDRVLSELANGWIKHGHEVTFVTNKNSMPPYFPTYAKIEWVDDHGLPAENNNLAPYRRKLNGAKSLFSLYLALKRIRKSYDIVLANQSLTTWPTVLAGGGKRKSFYYIQAYEPEYYSANGGIKNSISMLLSKISYYLPLTQVCNAPIYIGYKNISAKDWIPPGIDLRNFHSAKKYEELSTKHELVIGCIGRKEPTKGTHYVIKAFLDLYEQDKRYKLRVAFGNLPDDFHHQNLEIIIPKSDSELAAFYRSVDIVVAPGTVQHGAIHYPVMESLACGTPVVHTGYMPGNESNSWVISPNSSDAIVVAIKDIVKSKDLPIKIQNGVEEVKQYSWERVCNDFLTVIEKRRNLHRI